MLESALLQLPRVRIHKCNLLKARMVIRSYNDHCSAPFSRALVGWHHQSLLGRGSRHCYGINFINYPSEPYGTAGRLGIPFFMSATAAGLTLRLPHQEIWISGTVFQEKRDDSVFRYF
jgi:hypothetical protein